MRKYLGKTDKLSYICHGKADKIRPFNNRKGDKDMIKRKIDRYLADFFETNKKALMLTGARQIGKTYSIRRFGHEHFERFIEINFIENPGLVKVFSKAKNSQDILLRLSTVTSQDLIKGSTLVFFDEVQECPEIVTAIKFLVEEGSYRYVLSGSLLGVEIKNLRSAPVGYMDVKDMYPLDLEEFATAVGINDRIIDALRKHFTEGTAVDEFIHEKMMEVFRLYLIVGGMPAAVDKYLATNNLQDVMAEQQAIIRLYHKIQFTLALVVIIIQLETVRPELLCYGILIYRTKVDGRFVIQNLQLNAIRIKTCQKTNICHKQLE